jgi:transposase-like protein
MRQSRFTDEQMVAILREADREPVSAVAKRHGASEQTINVWRQPSWRHTRSAKFDTRSVPGCWFYGQLDGEVPFGRPVKAFIRHSRAGRLPD